MKYFIFFIMGLFLNPIKNCNAQFLNNLELNTSISKEMYGINQFSNTFKVGFDYKIDDKKHVGLETGIILGLNDFLLRVRYLSDPFKIHKVYPLYVNYSFFKNRNQFSIALGTELFEFGPNNVLEYSYWWTSGNNVIIPGEANDFKIRDRMQLIVPFTYGYQFYKNLSATAGITFYRTKCFEPDSYFDVTYFHHLTYSVGLKHRFKRKGDE